MVSLKFALLLMIGVFPILARAQDCASATAAGVAFRYCLDRSPSDRVLFFFHSATANENQWTDGTRLSGDALKALWGDQRPAVVSISFGTTWLVSARMRTSPEVVRQAMAIAEAKLGHPVAHRAALGISMGGLNALALAFADPHLFDRVASLCPAVSELDPFAPAAMVDDFLDQHDEANAEGLSVYQALFQPLYGSSENWRAERLDQMSLPTNLPPLHIATNTRDQMGFLSGGRALIAHLTGHELTSESVDGHHCVGVYTPAVAEFLIR